MTDAATIGPESTGRRTLFRVPTTLTSRSLVLVLCVAVLTMRLFQSYRDSRLVPLDEMSDACQTRYFAAFRLPFVPQRLATLMAEHPECVTRENPFPLAPQWFALLLLAALIGLQLVVEPALRIFRRGLTEMRPEAFPDGGDLFGEVVRAAGVGHGVRFRCAAGDSRVGGAAFGYPWRKYVVLDGGLVPLAKDDPETFRGVLLHELAHVRNNDLGITALTVATWRAFVAVTLLPFAFLFFADEQFTTITHGGLTAVQLIPFSVLALVARNGVLHGREYLADATAARWAAGTAGLDRLLARDDTVRHRIRVLFGFHPSPAHRRRALAESRPLWTSGLFDVFLLGALTGLAWPSVLYVLRRETFFDVGVSASLRALWPLTVIVGAALATTVAGRARGGRPSGTSLVSVVFAAGVIGGVHLTFTGSGLGLFPVEVPFSWSMAWCGVLVAVCWLWSMIVDVTARQWSWASPRVAIPVLVAVEAALLTLVLAPLLAARIDLQIIESLPSSDSLPHLLDLRGAEPALVVVLAAAVIFPVIGRLTPVLARLGGTTKRRFPD
jgi:Zn-dependent protease with chaperone function